MSRPRILFGIAFNVKQILLATDNADETRMNQIEFLIRVSSVSSVASFVLDAALSTSKSLEELNQVENLFPVPLGLAGVAIFEEDFGQGRRPGVVEEGLAISDVSE